MNFENQVFQEKEKEKRKRGFHEKLGRVSRHCGIFLLGALMEFTSVVQAQDLERGNAVEQKEKTENNILYRSPRAEKELKQYERLYPSFKELKTPIMVGSFEEELEKFSIDARISYEIGFRDVGAMAFPGQFMPEDARNRWKYGKDTIYIMYGTGLDKVPLGSKMRIPFHEGMHAKHFAEQLQKNPSDTTGYLRYPELSLKTNGYLEELMTGFNTIQWLESESAKRDNSILTKEEKECLPQSIRGEKGYFLDNYYNYYHSRYGNKFDVPAGETQPNDSIDGEVETMFRSGGILEELKERAEEMRQGEK